MKVYVQVIDTFTGVYQTGMIDERIQKDLDVSNALAHFGVRYGDVDWEVKEPNYGFGKVRDAFKVVIYYDY